MNKVLVIEDDAPLCWLLEKILRGKYEVIVMNNGLEAWSWLSDGNSCDLIISDVRMPSLSGIELLENLSNSGLFRNIPVIMLSGLEDSREECLNLGAFAYMVKPFEPQKFLNEVSRALLQNSDKVLMSN
jgi:two-component system, chemotaxis family, chemotaxis protein CheY